MKITAQRQSQECNWKQADLETKHYEFIPASTMFILYLHSVADRKFGFLRIQEEKQGMQFWLHSLLGNYELSSCFLL
jgi:hypothetical protein